MPSQHACLQSCLICVVLVFVVCFFSPDIAVHMLGSIPQRQAAFADKLSKQLAAKSVDVPENVLNRIKSGLEKDEEAAKLKARLELYNTVEVEGIQIIGCFIKFFL